VRERARERERERERKREREEREGKRERERERARDKLVLHCKKHIKSQFDKKSYKLCYHALRIVICSAI
jgi:hypothetical protein